jgi:hypothetical protein
VNNGCVVAVAAVSTPPRKRFVAGAARALHGLHTLAPALYDRIARLMTDYDHFRDAPAPPTSGAVLDAMADGSGVRGGWAPPATRRRRRAMLGAALVAPALLAWRATRRAA